ncbi:hypothetical protein N7501_007144 [Penicillium viridicatum]|nr:hypothetical protein N7501_007144 [Penicillium viridicatum]
MTCLRVSIREWTEGDPVALCPFSVACYAETYDGKNYRHCNSLHKACDSLRSQEGSKATGTSFWLACPGQKNHGAIMDIEQDEGS